MNSRIPRRSAATALLAATLLGFGMPVATQAAVPTQGGEAFAPRDVAVDADGNIYLSSPGGELTRVPAGTDRAEPFGRIDGLAADDPEPIGIATDAEGGVYAAVASTSATLNGVWRLDASTGEAARVEGSESIGNPNDVGIAADGTLYVTDAESGTIWALRPGEPAEAWVTDPLLDAPRSSIAIAEGTVYVAGLDAMAVIAVPIEADGTAGTPHVHANLSEPIGGLAVDAAGGIITVHPGADRASRIYPDGRIEAVPGADGRLDQPSSVALLDHGDGTTSAIVVNAGPDATSPASTGPSVVTFDYVIARDAGPSPTELAATPATVTVEAGDLWFAPSEVSVSADEPTTLVLVGVGKVAHNLTVDELGLQLAVGPGTSAEVTLSDVPPGTYQFYCSVFGHRAAGMFGTLTIE